MSTSNNVSVGTNGPSIKNTLMAKESKDYNIRPVNYFMEVISKNDVFATIFEDIISFQKEGKVFHYEDNGIHKKLNAFVVVQDRHGVSYVCPVQFGGELKSTGQIIRPLNFDNQESRNAFIDDVNFGTMYIDEKEFIDVCSLGFDHASCVMLGKQRAKMMVDYTLVASFHWRNPN